MCHCQCNFYCFYFPTFEHFNVFEIFFRPCSFGSAAVQVGGGGGGRSPGWPGAPVQPAADARPTARRLRLDHEDRRLAAAGPRRLGLAAGDEAAVGTQVVHEAPDALRTPRDLRLPAGRSASAIRNEGVPKIIINYTIFFLNCNQLCTVTYAT